MLHPDPPAIVFPSFFSISKLSVSLCFCLLSYPRDFVESPPQVFSFQMQYERLRGSSDAIGSHKVLLQAHAGGVVAMDAHPTRNECTTVGQDSTVRVWDLDERALCAFLRVDQDSGDATAVAYSPDGVILALGMTKGRILFLVSPEAGGAWGHGLHECAHRDLNEEKRFVEVGSQNVSALRYSPDGQMLAVGMKNGRLAVVRIEEEGTGYDVYQVRVSAALNCMHDMHRLFLALFCDLQKVMRCDKENLARCKACTGLFPRSSVTSKSSCDRTKESLPPCERCMIFTGSLP